MANQNGIAIVIKAWLPVTGSISEQIAKLQMVETAHSTGDYAELLKTATVEDIKTEQKTRRMEDAPADPAPPFEDTTAPLPGGNSGVETVDDADVPEFLKKDKKPKAA